MAEPFKNMFNPEVIAIYREHFSDRCPSFDGEAFEAAALAGLQGELKERVLFLAGLLRTALPPSYERCVEVLLTRPPKTVSVDQTTSGFYWWPVLTLVEVYGLDQVELSLEVLKAWTGVFSAEFAIRPFLVAHHDQVQATLDQWVDSEDVHLRRLVSEGTRPNLPWGKRLPVNPRSLQRLRLLAADPERYVQRSVANHVNDVTRLNKELAFELLNDWVQQPPTQWVVSHATRSLVKQGDSHALALNGYNAPKFEVRHEIEVLTDPLKIGTKLLLRLVVQANAEQNWMVDWCIEEPGKKKPRKRVVKGSKLSVKPKQQVVIEKSIHWRHTSTKTLLPGTVTVTAQLNGLIISKATFEAIN